MGLRNRRLVWLGVLGALVVAYGPAAPAFAESGVQSETKSFSIPAQSLSSALIAFGEQAGLQFSVDQSVVASARTEGVSGRLSVNDALARLLAGSGLTWRFTAVNTVVLEKAPNTRGAKLLGPVEVEGVQTAGANGSTDVTATEGTGSYTTGAMAVGSKAPLSIKETPQSVSIITRQRIEEQNLSDLTSALNQATGVTLAQVNSIQTKFVSRGFQITTFQIDGGAPLDLGNNTFYFTTPDLAEYDHVEILRGSDALFGGQGNPGGIVSLERKRPLDHEQLIAQGQIGSWSNDRAELDATGPIGFDGHLRGRVVTVYQDRDFFYKISHQRKTLLYGVVEADLPWDTLLRVGGSYEQQDNVPNFLGLPRYTNGNDLHLPTSTCLCADWNRWNFQTSELFAALEHKFTDDWSIKTNVTRLAQTSDEKYAPIGGAVNPVTLAGPTYLGTTAFKYNTVQYGVDTTLNGSFLLLGRKHDVTIGADYSDNSADYIRGSALASTAFNIFNFQPSIADPEPATPATNRIIQPFNIVQYGFYSNLRLRILDSVSLIGGFRLSDIRVHSTTRNFNPSTGQQTSVTTSTNSDNNVLTPYGGIVWDVTKTYSLYASYAEIYQSQASTLDASGTPLLPITGDTYEIGAKAAWFDGGLNGSVAAYHTERNNAAISDPSVTSFVSNGFACCYLASGKVLSQGIDLEISGQLAPELQVSAGYTYNYNQFESGYGTSNGQAFTSQSPKHLFKLWTTYQLPGRFDQWTVGGGVTAQTSNYVSGNVCPSFNPNSSCAAKTIPFNFTQGGYGVFSGRIAYQIDERWSASLNVNNILDKTYYQTVGTSASGNWYGDPRNFMFTLRCLN